MNVEGMLSMLQANAVIDQGQSDDIENEVNQSGADPIETLVNYGICSKICI